MATETLSFPSEKDNDFMLELREKVDDYFEQNHLSKRGNVSLVIKTIVMLSLYLIPYLLMVTGVITSTPLILGCWILMGLGMAGVGTDVMPDSEYPLPDEEGSMENNWVVHQLLVTADYARHNKPLTWLLGGLNYHAVHHLFPHISHVHYPKISPIIKEVTDQYGITYREQPTFFKAIGQHEKMLKLLGRKR